jgi:hypothetical protein
MIARFASCAHAMNRVAHPDALAARCAAAASLVTFPASKAQYETGELLYRAMSAGAIPRKW